MLRRTNSCLHVLPVDLNVSGLKSIKALSGNTPKNWQTKARCHVLSSLMCSWNFEHVNEREQKERDPGAISLPKGDMIQNQPSAMIVCPGKCVASLKKASPLRLMSPLLQESLEPFA